MSCWGASVCRERLPGRWAALSLFGSDRGSLQRKTKLQAVSFLPSCSRWESRKKLCPIKRKVTQQCSSGFLWSLLSYPALMCSHKQTKDKMFRFKKKKRRGREEKERRVQSLGILRSNGCHTRPLWQIPISFHHRLMRLIRGTEQYLVPQQCYYHERGNSY